MWPAWAERVVEKGRRGSDWHDCAVVQSSSAAQRGIVGGSKSRTLVWLAVGRRGWGMQIRHFQGPLPQKLSAPVIGEPGGALDGCVTRPKRAWRLQPGA